jgi:3-oxoadipate enol-lactonase
MKRSGGWRPSVGIGAAPGHPVPEALLSTGVRLYWRELGDPQAPAVVWVHGGSIEESSSMLADLEPFADRIRAIFPDTRGHGLSQKFERVEDYTYAAKAPDMLALLDRLGVDRAVFGGASMGACLALRLAIDAPERVRAVVSISGPPFAPLEADRRWWREHRGLVAAGRFEEFFAANVRLRMGEASLARLKARPARYAALVDNLKRHSIASLLALLDETYSRTTWVDECRTIRCPVQVIGGSKDHFPTPDMSAQVAARIPGARLHIVAGGPHFPNRTHRAEVQRVLGEFLRDVGLFARSE